MPPTRRGQCDSHVDPRARTKTSRSNKSMATTSGSADDHRHGRVLAFAPTAPGKSILPFALVSWPASRE
jgi:hypothetical protein